MNSLQAADHKPHAVFVAYPAQGHINPLLKLAILIHHKGFHITFVNTEETHNRLLQSRGPESLDGSPDFRFETIPDGLRPAKADATQETKQVRLSSRKNCLAPFCKLLQKLNESSSENVPPVSCIIFDALMSFAATAADEIGVPSVCVRTSAACCFMLYKHYHLLTQKGLLPPKDEISPTTGHLDTTIDCIPGIKSIRLKDLPTFIQTISPNDEMLEFIIGEVERASKASAIIFNTCKILEFDVLHALSSMYPPIYSIGPLPLLVNQLPENNKLKKSVGSNLWKEETNCIQWLNSRKANSVIYVNYGSLTVMTREILVEFAWGLANSKQNFLWIIRPDLVKGETGILPFEFFEDTKETGMIAGWCSQEEVLGHPSVGGFLTHCGWNSMIESLSSGVPMICWPFFADQPTNCKLACKDWGVGLEIDKNVKRNEVEMRVRELMEGEKGVEMRKKAMDWKKKAQEATRAGGSSALNLDKLVEEVLLCKP